MSTNVANLAKKQAIPNDIRPLPAIAIRLTQECQRSTPDVTAVVSLIESDPALAAKVLEVANSSLFGYPRKINNIPRAAIVLGLRSIATIAITSTSKEVFADPQDLESKKNLHRHSLACAVVARLVAEHFNAADPNAAFLAGLLHDFGKLAFMSNPEVRQAEQHFRESPSARISKELELFGMSHDAVGAGYVRKMNLPAEIGEAILQHHQPMKGAKPNGLGEVVSLANGLAKSWFDGIPGDHFQSDSLGEMESQAVGNFEALRCLS